MSINITTYSLSVEELALALGLINCGGLGRELLDINSLSEEQVDSRLISASHSLLAHGLCTSSQSNIPILAPELEQALFPLARFDHVLQLEIAYADQLYTANVHVQKGRAFTVHSSHMGVVHTLEYGHDKELVGYLYERIFAFGCTLDAPAGPEIKLGSNVMNQVLESLPDQAKMVDILIAHGWSKDDAEKIVGDVTSSKLRVTMTQVISDSSNDQKSPEAKKMMLLLNGDSRCWLIDFPDVPGQADGSARIVDHPTLVQAMTAFLK